MTLIAILLAIVTERYWHPFSSYKLFKVLLSWRDALVRYCGRRVWFDGAVGVLLTVAPAVVITGLIQYGLAGTDGFLMWLLTLVFSLLVLVACIGEQRFGAYVRKYLDAVSAGDRVAASDYLNSISSKVYAADNWRQINLGFLRLLLLRLNERVLALLFWFVVLGPMGAVLYRSVAQLQGSTPTDDKSVMQEDIAGFQGDGYRDSTQRLKGIMDWLPVRLAALCFSMIGSFTDAMQQWRGDKQHHVDDWVVENNRLLLEVGIGALQLQDDYKDDAADLDVDEAGEHVLAARSLSKRTLLVWVTILALMTLIGWLG